MANVNNPYGLRALGNLSATGAQKQYGYTIDDNQAGAIFQGDLVTVVAGFLVKFAPGSHVSAVGVFNGCFYNDPTTWASAPSALFGRSYRPTILRLSAAVVAWVAKLRVMLETPVTVLPVVEPVTSALLPIAA